MSEHAGKVALITGITGQDGSYLTELLLSKGYTVSFDNILMFGNILLIFSGYSAAMLHYVLLRSLWRMCQ
jgi:hypothetical protein